MRKRRRRLKCPTRLPPLRSRHYRNDTRPGQIPKEKLTTPSTLVSGILEGRDGRDPVPVHVLRKWNFRQLEAFIRSTPKPAQPGENPAVSLERPRRSQLSPQAARF